MYFTTQSSIQLNAIFGGGYVHEQHGDGTRGYLPHPDNREFIVDFAEVLKALRAALSLR